MRKLTTETFIQRAREKHGDKFDYSLVNYINRRTPIKIICSIHGLFEQMPDAHIASISGCPKCRYVNGAKSLRKTTDDFVKRMKNIHPEYDYSLVEYTKAVIPVKVICPKHGIFLMKPNCLLMGQNCPLCSHSSKPEEIISEYLNRKGFVHGETYFRNQRFKDLGRLSYDFYIPSRNLLIEYNGMQHYKNIKFYHSDFRNLKRQRHHDWLKRKFARDNEIELLTIPYTEFDNIESILENKIGTLI